MTKVNDLTGKRFGLLTVLWRTTNDPKTQKARFMCRCVCGKETTASGNSLSRGNTKSCGCYKPRHIKDYSGQRFGRLTVVKFDSIIKTNSRFLCRCDCGSDVLVMGFNLVQGDTKSCGCYRTQCLKERGTLNGKHDSKEYACWCAMKDRVKNSMYYIKKGRQVCSEYQTSFASFDRDLGPRPEDMNSVDRKDNNGHYSCGKCPQCKQEGWPMNIQWANAKMQANNTSRNRKFRYMGKTKSLSEWSELCGIKRTTLYYRICKFNWDVEEALTTQGQLANKPKDIIFE